MELETTWDTEFPNRKVCAFGAEKPVFFVIEVREAASPRHIAFQASDRKAVDPFHKAASGSDRGEPGLRPIYHEHYYGSFALDPDGNNVEAVTHRPE